METGSIQTTLPSGLATDLYKMRRNPADFSVSGRVKCRFCPEPKSAYHLINAKFGNRVVGSWCSEHGWLFFDSVELPPTERLTVTEQEDRRSAKERQAKFQDRKQAALAAQEGEQSCHTTSK